MAEATNDPIRLPAGPKLPMPIQGWGLAFARNRARSWVTKRYGSTYCLNLPFYGHSLVVSEPSLLKELFVSASDLVSRPAIVGRVLGPGSLFSLTGAEHRRRRKLLVPPFHGKRMETYSAIVEEEFMSEARTWPEGIEFESLSAMARITGNVFLRAVFGASGAVFDDLRYLAPRTLPLAGRLLAAPEWLRRDLGPWSPWAKVQAARKLFDDLVAQLIAEARADPNPEARTDILALMLQARYDDGSPITDAHISDELLTLLVAGLETTATTLTWTVERLRRSPDVMAQLVDEVDNGGTALAQATIWEVQRYRPALSFVARRAETRMRLGQWVVPEGHCVIADIWAAHHASDSFEEPERFDPSRFADGPPESYAWVPFGGGMHRCIGAAFANMQMTTVLRTLLREFELSGTDAPAEPVHFRGVANAPGRGGRVVVRRRSAGSHGGYASGDATLRSVNDAS
ncbi:cytochrome P450 [Mycobacterium haemophilum]|uniref:Cytochrome P450 n=1 Tax=Mycobacterium haemophilum TaxID=29311 RepID=A0A0I9TGA8_9MYCO|nr:cytochrome P450 [Mycobacterium haemophilum]KLO27588.1 cytochrome P450 [Mycobacterium haemophilum]KLO35176.1 cytochrome P450 [Mycobacterium haemophilum]KLO40166.1 cytochrome P450 [Mycobacterium haemophilum]KLO47447.1 cytochrome P450 [Mycobacterium haemophilum]